jgi:DUF1680 family protein
LTLSMPARRVVCHPYVTNNVGRVALMRGPLVYCLEGADHAGIDLRQVVLPAAALLESSFDPGLLGGVVVIRASGFMEPANGWEQRLYRSAEAEDARRPSSGRKPVTLKAVPYYAWANREPGAMQVWIRAASEGS